MGMAASQARLLALTARMHDVELKAQNIMAQKIALATQEDALYEDYCAALDATTIQVAFRNGADVSYVTANYESVCTYQENRRCKQYALRDNQSGLLLVPEEVVEAYNGSSDKYIFAYEMLGFGNSYGWGANFDLGSEIGIGKAQDSTNYTSKSGSGYSRYMTECEELVYNANTSNDELVEKYNNIIDAEGDAAKQTALNEFRECLYNKYAPQIFEYMNLDKEDDIQSAKPNDDRTWDDVAGEFNYYTRLWEAINQAGGCRAIDASCISGEKGNQWFDSMVNSGLATIMMFDDSPSKNSWSDTSVATSINNNYLQQVQDETDLKKAEAKYEHELRIINKKDTQFDNDLSKLETERSAIDTEMESIKKVREDNEKRTFGIFS